MIGQLYPQSNMGKKTLYLLRHGATDWSESGQQTSYTDLPLTPLGLEQSEKLAKRLQKQHFTKVFCSPLMRAQKTCEICGFKPTIDPDLVEWNYGKWEGMTYAEIRKQNPTWGLFEDGGEDGESPDEVAERARRFLQKINALEGKIAIFSSAHFLRVLATQWLGVPVLIGKHLLLSPGSVSILGFEHEYPAILCWNDISHLSIT